VGQTFLLSKFFPAFFGILEKKNLSDQKKLWREKITWQKRLFALRQIQKGWLSKFL
jgi:hypothetical protein